MLDRTYAVKRGPYRCQWKFAMLPVDRTRVILQLEIHFHYDLWLHHGFLLFDICGCLFLCFMKEQNSFYVMYVNPQKSTKKIGRQKCALHLFNIIYFYLARCCCSGCAIICSWHLPFCEIAPICVCNVTAPLTPMLLFGALRICDPSAVRRTPGRACARDIGVILFRKLNENNILISKAWIDWNYQYINKICWA